MRELKSLIKAIVNVVLLIAETAVFTNISLSALCVCMFLGEKRREKGGKKKLLERLKLLSVLQIYKFFLDTTICFLSENLGLYL